ncbi:MAG: hypothetical protein ACEQSB_01100 [Undibacterium sp.]
MDEIFRHVVYIRSADRQRPLFFRPLPLIKGERSEYWPVRRILYPDTTENPTLEIRAGDKVEIVMPGMHGKQVVKILEIPLSPDFTDEPKLAAASRINKA